MENGRHAGRGNSRARGRSDAWVGWDHGAFGVFVADIRVRRRGVRHPVYVHDVGNDGWGFPGERVPCSGRGVLGHHRRGLVVGSAAEARTVIGRAVVGGGTMGQPLQALLLIVGLTVAVVAVCGVLFVYWAKGLAVGTSRGERVSGLGPGIRGHRRRDLVVLAVVPASEQRAVIGRARNPESHLRNSGPLLRAAAAGLTGINSVLCLFSSCLLRGTIRVVAAGRGRNGLPAGPTNHRTPGTPRTPPYGH